MKSGTLPNTSAGGVGEEVRAGVLKKFRTRDGRLASRYFFIGYRRGGLSWRVERSYAATAVCAAGRACTAVRRRSQRARAQFSSRKRGALVSAWVRRAGSFCRAVATASAI